MRNPPRPAKWSRIHSYSDSLFGEDSELSESLEDIYNWPWSLCKTIVTDIFYSNNQRVAQWLLEPEAWASLTSA
jgi:hypothetical protein